MKEFNETQLAELDNVEFLMLMVSTLMPAKMVSDYPTLMAEFGRRISAKTFRKSNPPAEGG